MGNPHLWHQKCSAVVGENPLAEDSKAFPGNAAGEADPPSPLTAQPHRTCVNYPEQLHLFRASIFAPVVPTLDHLVNFDSIFKALSR